ncbi:uncharacterized protein LOC113873092 isoform X2 [Abrus precatorius]|uniref:Uncharacterized protein LOC113873092 isoform X2 n=1 Tax=Abrus precatorius TaxID=3816 RepID=A0A8B8MI22_ABRPR|nr:uncharacterized protein LOC113873092 isoform X2 [Abrus precatorius]
MSNSSGFALTKNSGSNRFYVPPVIRRNRKQQQQQQQQRPLETDSVEPVPIEPALPEAANSSNMDRLLASLTPLVPAKFSKELVVEGLRSIECNGSAYFLLEDLWESFREWSAYGVEVPLVVDGDDTIKQYYVPYLSAIQLYALRRLDEDSGTESSKEISSAGSSDNEADKRARGGNLMNINSQRLSRLTLREGTSLGSSSDETEFYNSPEQLVYEYFEGEQPHFRPPFHDKVSVLASEFPCLMKYRSWDISPSSWFSVAWYPIYRIPVGSTLKSLDASFLTFHSLSAHSRRKNQALSHASSGTKAAADWLKNLQVNHPDFQYFVTRSPQW